MKIEILSDDGSGVNGVEVFDIANNRHIHSPSSMFPRQWSEDEILALLGDKNYAKYEKGQYRFDILKRDIFKVSQDLKYFSL